MSLYILSNRLFYTILNRHKSVSNYFFNLRHYVNKELWKTKEFNMSRVIHICTLYNAILRIARNFLETKENIKISTHPFYPVNLDWFSWEWSKKKFFFWKKKNSKWPTQKNWVFQLPPKAEQLSPKFHRLVLGLVGLIDAKGINVTQPIWLSGCPM